MFWSLQEDGLQKCSFVWYSLKHCSLHDRTLLLSHLDLFCVCLFLPEHTWHHYVFALLPSKERQNKIFWTDPCIVQCSDVAQPAVCKLRQNLAPLWWMITSYLLKFKCHESQLMYCNSMTLQYTKLAYSVNISLSLLYQWLENFSRKSQFTCSEFGQYCCVHSWQRQRSILWSLLCLCKALYICFSS
jgi:hypothetical protein